MIETCPLGSVVDVSAGQPAPKSSEFRDEGLPFIRAGSLEKLLNGGSLSDCEKIPQSAATRNRFRVYPRGTVVFAKSGMSATLGRVYRLPEPAHVVSHLAALVPTGRYDPVFLTHWLRRNPPSHLIKDPAYPSIRVGDIVEVEVPAVPLEDQRRIGSVLDKADGIRRRRQSALDHVDLLIKGEFVARFGSPLKNEKNLQTAPISAFGRVVTGNTPPRKDPKNYGDAIEWIKSDNINTPSPFLTPSAERLSERGIAIGRTAPSGSTLVTCIAGSPSVIGNAALADRAVAFNQQINAVIPHQETDPYFLYCQVLVGKPLIQAASTNSMKGMVSKGKFQEIDFLAPSYNEQVEFGRFFLRAIEMSQKLQADLEASTELFSSLTHRAFRGEL